MTFYSDGFLSASMGSFCEKLRQEPTYDQWFGFAEELNTFSLGLIWHLELSSEDNQKVDICALFVRTQQAFQAALILAGRGMLSDARVVLRSAVEGVIAMHALLNDSTFHDRLIEVHELQRRKDARLVLKEPVYKASLTAEEIKQMETMLESGPDREPRNIIWEQTAAKYCPDLYDIIYRSLSSDGTHTNLAAIDRFLSFDKNGALVEMRVGPDNVDLVNVLRIACLTVLRATVPFIWAFAKHEHDAKVQEYLRRLTELPQGEPDDVRVEGEYES